MIQLHNGLAPFVKGRINCTNLCLAKKYYHLIGNSVIWTDNGIHSGNLLASEHTMFVGNESLKDIHIKVMEHGHDLCVRAVRYLTRGEKRSRPQSEFGEGNTYEASDWSFSQKRKLISGMASFPFEINSKETTRKREQVQVYSLRN
jgi:methionyl-tRNA formyltransferase